jgi:hypothetical protein
MSTTTVEHIHDKIELWQAFLWPMVTGLLNVLFRMKSPEQWVEFAEKQPRLAGVVRLIRAAGFDPVKSMESLKQVAAKKPAPAKNSDTSTVSGGPVDPPVAVEAETQAAEGTEPHTPNGSGH